LGPPGIGLLIGNGIVPTIAVVGAAGRRWWRRCIMLGLAGSWWLDRGSAAGHRILAPAFQLGYLRWA
jgi:hypothetical protein